MLKNAFILAFLIGFFNSFSAVIKVGKGFSLQSIQKAVEIARSNDTIIVAGGIYKEKNLLINKPLSIIGENNPVLDGEDKYEIITLSAANCLIKGLTLQHSGYSSFNDYAALKIIDALNFRIENNTIMHAHFAIHISNSNSFTVKNNKITGTPGADEQSTGNGIHLWKCTNALITGNSISGHRDGIYFEFVQSSTVEKNYSMQNIRYGLHFMFSNDDHYSFNTFNDNGAGVAVMFSHHIIMKKNKFANNRGASSYGLLLKEISDGEISSNQFTGNTTGIYMEGTNRIHVTHNLFESNGYAMRVQASCSDNRVDSNNYFSNTFDVATNGTLVLNNFNNNYWDKYEGYDLKRDGIGDIPYRPVSMYSMIIETTPVAVIFLRRLMVNLLDKTEKAIPSITPENLTDDSPLMKPVKL